MLNTAITKFQFFDGKNNEKIVIDLSKWELFNKGFNHILLSFSEVHQNSQLIKFQGKFVKQTDLVIIIRQKDTINYFQSFKQMQNIYQKLIGQQNQSQKIKLQNTQLLESLKKHTLKRQKLFFSKKQDQIEFVKEINSRNYVKEKFPLIQYIQISENLLSRNNFDWDFVIEFKPKTPLPEFYSLETINYVENELMISSQEIQTIIMKSEPNEKTRQFKKSLLSKNLATNGGVFQIFQLNKAKQCDFTSTKQQKRLFRQNKIQTKPEFTPEQKITINKLVRKSLIQTKILNEIVCLQSLYKKPIDFIRDDFELLSEIQLEKEEITKIQNQIFQQALNLYKNREVMLENILLTQKIIFKEKIIKYNKNNKVQEIQLFRQTLKFLISHTLKDISIFIRGKFSNNDLQSKQEYDLKIIDWKLKNTQSVKLNIKKQKTYLKQYIKFKLNQHQS